MTTKLTDSANRFWTRIIFVLSIVICGAVAFLLLGPRPEGVAGTLDVSMLPAVNASLNGLTIVFLVTGLTFIKLKRIEWHRNSMLTAFGCSSAFLVTYVLYHWFTPGPKIYEGDFRGLYLFILGTHITLAAVILPMALLTLYRGWTDQRREHRALARITLPVWLYVSVTGVLIYGMLYW
jgi:putative membrane protein